MRLGTIEEDAGRTVVVVDERGVVAVEALVPGFEGDLMALVTAGLGPVVQEALLDADPRLFTPESEVTFGAPYLRPRKIWGIGLNYVDHAADLAESAPDEPASFIKGDHTIIGPGDPIPIPVQSRRTTAEAEIGLVIGREARDVEPQDALDHVFGIVPVLDQTAEDILRRNPRFLTRSKNFPGFFAFGPTITTLDEALPAGVRFEDLDVATMINGRIHRSNTVGRMMHGPAELVSFHSKVMPLYPGDIISTGTPGAVVISPGDVVACRIDRLPLLQNPVA
jgi:2-keto-4-pentenoate hydratase/2-oxohepta-3-ene-1,7-dioic acid hydratase in catechol pathway